MTTVVWAVVFVVGGCGSVLRFAVDGVVSARLGRNFPIGTLAVNLSGTFVLGLLTGLVLPHDEALLAGTAAVGSYTTFSTWLFETHRLAEERQHARALGNLAGSLAFGLAGAALGRWLGTSA